MTVGLETTKPSGEDAFAPAVALNHAAGAASSTLIDTAMPQAVDG